MAVKTKAAILAEIASLLADNTTGDISASDVRTCLNDIVDSYPEGGAKVYKALLTQSGTNAPTSTELVNTLGGTPSWIYDGTGTYRFEIGNTIAPDLNKIFVLIGNNYGEGYTIAAYTDLGGSGNRVNVYVTDNSDSPINSILSNTPITIEVYP